MLKDKKFPSKRNIKHNGYMILAEMEIARIRRTKIKKKGKEWDRLISEAKKIPNEADVSLLLSYIARAISRNKFREKVKSLLEESEMIAKKLPAILDKIGRCELIASSASMADFDDIYQRILKEIFENIEFKNRRFPEIDYMKKEIIDFAYGIDPNLASSLASVADEDPARIKRGKTLKDEIKLLELRKNIIENTFSKDSNYKEEDYPNANWMCLGKLNSGRIVGKKYNNAIKLIETSINFPLTHSYPIVSYAIENLVVTYMNTDHARKNIYPIYEAVLLSLDFCKQISLVLPGKDKVVSLPEPENNNNIIVKSGEKDKAIKFITNWIENNVEKYLKICDPYFGPDELFILKIVLAKCRKCKIKILTSTKYHTDNKIDDCKKAYIKAWKKISDEQPPDTRIYIYGTECGGKLPVHDRWGISEKSAIRFGTSLKSLGKRESEISIVDKDKKHEHEGILDEYFMLSKHTHNNEKVICHIMFDLVV